MTEYILKDNESAILIWTLEELELMFPNEIQRDIFIKGLVTIVNVIMERIK